MNIIKQALALAMLLASTLIGHAQQHSVSVPQSGPMSMATFTTTFLNPSLQSILGNYSGTATPALYFGAPVQYQWWMNTTPTPPQISLYDGSSWVPIGALNTSTHAFGVASVGPAYTALANATNAAAVDTNVPLSGTGVSLKIATAVGTLTNGHCVQIDATGDFVDSGSTCGGGGGSGTVTAGTTGQIAYYPGNAASVSGETVSGDATIAVGGALTIAANAVTPAKMAQLTSYTALANATNATANATDVALAGTGASLKIATATGSLTSGHCVSIDATGDFQDSGAACAGGSSAGVFSVCNVKNNGATGNGSTDDTTAIQNTWNIAGCQLIYMPAGTYKISSTLTAPGHDGAGILGDGMYDTIITSTATTGTMIQGHVSLNGQRYENFQLTRSGVATAGVGLATGDPGNWAVVRNLYITNQFVGIEFDGMAYGWAENIAAVSNHSDGIKITSASANSLQWQFQNIISENNGACGINVVGSNQSSGNWSGLATFNNTTCGLSITNVAAVRIQNSFFGSDHGDEVSISGGAANYTHSLTNVYTELSATGVGFRFTNATAGVTCSNCSAVGNFLSGFLLNGSSTFASVSGGNFSDNGVGAQSGNNGGITCVAGSISITGIVAINSGNQSFSVINGGCTNISLFASHATSFSGSITFSGGNF